MAKSTFEEILSQLEGENLYKASFQKDVVKFNFPDMIVKPLKQQLQEATSPIGGGKFKPQSNDKQFTDDGKTPGKNKQLQLSPSSTIQQAAYFPEKEYLVVSFKSGHTYDYKSVPLLKMMQWEQAASAGSFFYYNIRMSYPYSKLG
jgi:hypothetical protein